MNFKNILISFVLLIMLSATAFSGTLTLDGTYFADSSSVHSGTTNEFWASDGTLTTDGLYLEADAFRTDEFRISSSDDSYNNVFFQDRSKGETTIRGISNVSRLNSNPNEFVVTGINSRAAKIHFDIVDNTGSVVRNEVFDIKQYLINRRLAFSSDIVFIGSKFSISQIIGGRNSTPEFVHVVGTIMVNGTPKLFVTSFNSNDFTTPAKDSLGKDYFYYSRPKQSTGLDIFEGRGLNNIWVAGSGKETSTSDVQATLFQFSRTKDSVTGLVNNDSISFLDRYSFNVLSAFNSAGFTETITKSEFKALTEVVDTSNSDQRYIIAVGSVSYKTSPTSRTLTAPMIYKIDKSGNEVCSKVMPENGIFTDVINGGFDKDHFYVLENSRKLYKFNVSDCSLDTTNTISNPLEFENDFNPTGLASSVYGETWVYGNKISSSTGNELISIKGVTSNLNVRWEKDFDDGVYDKEIVYAPKSTIPLNRVLFLGTQKSATEDGYFIDEFARGCKTTGTWTSAPIDISNLVGFKDQSEVNWVSESIVGSGIVSGSTTVEYLTSTNDTVYGAPSTSLFSASKYTKVKVTMTTNDPSYCPSISQIDLTYDLVDPPKPPTPPVTPPVVDDGTDDAGDSTGGTDNFEQDTSTETNSDGEDNANLAEEPEVVVPDNTPKFEYGNFVSDAPPLKIVDNTSPTGFIGLFDLGTIDLSLVALGIVILLSFGIGYWYFKKE